MLLLLLAGLRSLTPSLCFPTGFFNSIPPIEKLPQPIVDIFTDIAYTFMDLLGLSVSVRGVSGISPSPYLAVLMALALIPSYGAFFIRPLNEIETYHNPSLAHKMVGWTMGVSYPGFAWEWAWLPLQSPFSAGLRSFLQHSPQLAVCHWVWGLVRDQPGTNQECYFPMAAAACRDRDGLYRRDHQPGIFMMHSNPFGGRCLA